MRTKHSFAFIGILTTVTLLGFAGNLAAQHPLDSWVRRSVPSPNANLNSVAFGNGVFVAVGDASFVARSADGANWTTGTAGAYGNLKRVRFLNGEFVAVGSSDKLLFSADGATWTSSTLPASGFADIAAGNGGYVLAGANTYASPDALSWTVTHPILTRPFGFPPYETPLDTVVFGNGVFVGLPAGGLAPSTGTGRKSVYSTNGVDWFEGGLAPTSAAGSQGSSELLFADGVWLASSEYANVIANSGLSASTNNGVNWCCGFKGYPDDGQGGAMAYGQGYYVWFQDSVRIHAFVSTNGLNWTLRFTETNQGGAKSAAFGNGTFVAVGIDGVGGSYILQSANIGGLPQIFQEPQDRGAIVGNPASFSVQAVGAPPLAYQWYFNSNAIANATNSTYSISSVVAGDGGAYHVVITNSFGSVTSRVAQLTVAFLGIDSYAGVKVFGVPGRTYRIEASPSTGAPSWQTVTNLVLPSSPYIWIDYESPSLPARIYRAAELP